jgi:hypothetical protein
LVKSVAYAAVKKVSARAVDTTGSDMLLLGVISGAIMSADMGTFRVDVEIENHANPGAKRTIGSVLVDTGAELSWFPAEVLESLRIERSWDIGELQLTTTGRGPSASQRWAPGGLFGTRNWRRGWPLAVVTFFRPRSIICAQ